MFMRLATGASLLLFVLLSLSACGGGGGDDVAVTPNVTSLQFSGIAGETIASQDIQVTLTNAQGTVYAAVEVADSTVASASFSITGTTTAVITVTPSAFRSPGTYRTTVFLRVYRNPNGTDLLNTFTYPVTLTVLPGLSVNPASVSLGALEGQTTQATVAVSVPQGASGAVQAQLAPGQAAAPFLSFTVLGSTGVQIDASAVSLPAGVYQRELEISVPRGNGVVSLRVPVTFTVGVGLIAPAPQTIVLEHETPLAALAGSVNVQRADGAASTWSATSSVPWLVLASGNGTTPGTLGYSVDAAQVPPLPQFADSTATITLTTPGLTPVSFTVTLSKRLPYVVAAGPYGVPANSAVRVIVGGRGFQQLGNSAASLFAPGLAVTSVSALSDDLMELEVTTPAGAGHYTIGITHTSGIQTPSALLAVTTPFAYAPATVAHAGPKNIYLHDPMRRAVFALSRTGNVLVRYRFDAGSNNWGVTSMPHAGPLNMALAPDGSRIWLTDNSNRVVEVDPDTMTVPNMYIAPFGITQNLGGTLPVSADGRLWLPGGARYFDLRTRTFEVFNDIAPPNVEYGSYHGTLDGTLVIISPSWTFTPLPPYAVYDTASGQVSSPMGNLELGYEPRLAIDGSLTLHEFTGQLFNRQFALLGQVPQPADVDSHALMTLTPDGSKILVLRNTYSHPSHFTLVSQAIDIYSTGTFAPGTTNFAKTGSLPIATNASDCSGGNDCFYGNQYLLPTQDSKTLFWIGNQNLQVFSIP